MLPRGLVDGALLSVDIGFELAGVRADRTADADGWKDAAAHEAANGGRRDAEPGGHFSDSQERAVRCSDGHLLRLSERLLAPLGDFDEGRL